MPFRRLIAKLFGLSGSTEGHAEELPSADLIRAQGWRQWSCVAGADIPRFLDAIPASSLPDPTRLLVVTQSCDLVHHDYANEPFVETFRCEWLGPDHRPDGNLTYGKNPRSLAIPFRVDGIDHWFVLHSRGRALTSRHKLAALDPDRSIVVPDGAIRTLQRWLVNRTIRTAFPDAFNARTEKARRLLERKLKNNGQELIGLYVNISPWDELSQDETYSVDFVGLVGVGLEAAHRKPVESVLGDIAAAYEGAEGIASCDYQVQDEEEASLALLQTHRLFPLDFMSLGDKPGGELPPAR